MKPSLDPTMKHQIDRMVNALCSEYAGDVDRPQIEGVTNDSVDVVGVRRVIAELGFDPREELRALERCHGAQACSEATHVDAGTNPA